MWRMHSKRWLDRRKDPIFLGPPMPNKPGLQSSKLQCASDNMIAFFSSTDSFQIQFSSSFGWFIETSPRTPYFLGRKTMVLPMFRRDFSHLKATVSGPTDLLTCRPAKVATARKMRLSDKEVPGPTIAVDGTRRIIPLTRWPVDSLRSGWPLSSLLKTGKTGKFPWFFGYVYQRLVLRFLSWEETWGTTKSMSYIPPKKIPVRPWKLSIFEWKWFFQPPKNGRVHVSLGGLRWSMWCHPLHKLTNLVFVWKKWRGNAINEEFSIFSTAIHSCLHHDIPTHTGWCPPVIYKLVYKSH